MSQPKVALCWATKKRHIALDGKVLCQPNHTSAGYSVKNGQYNTLTLSGLPDYEKNTDDAPYCHADGLISFLPLQNQPFKIIERSICGKCLKKYNTTLAKSTQKLPATID